MRLLAISVYGFQPEQQTRCWEDRPHPTTVRLSACTLCLPSSGLLLLLLLLQAVEVVEAHEKRMHILSA